MSRNYCNNESSCCNPCNGYSNGISDFNSSWFYILAIFLLFGGGFGKGGFWSDYNKIFSCSGFNNGWCNNSGFNSGNFIGNNLSNINSSN